LLARVDGTLLGTNVPVVPFEHAFDVVGAAMLLALTAMLVPLFASVEIAAAVMLTRVTVLVVLPMTAVTSGSGVLQLPLPLLGKQLPPMAFTKFVAVPDVPLMSTQRSPLVQLPVLVSNW
jgi:hypothetical protein